MIIFIQKVWLLISRQHVLSILQVQGRSHGLFIRVSAIVSLDHAECQSIKAINYSSPPKSFEF